MDTNAKTAITLALIAAAQAIVIAAITAGWDFFGSVERGEDPEQTVAELQLTTDVFPLRTPAPDNCIERLRLALEEEEFEDSGRGEEVLVLRRGAFKTAVWCRPTEIVATVAGRRNSATADVLAIIEDAAADAGLLSPLPDAR